MLPDLTLPLPASLMGLLGAFQPLFTAPSFRTFCALSAGFLAQTGRHTVCGMLTGAGLSRAWRHDRAHRFFSHARWSSHDLGVALAKLIVALLVPDGEPVLATLGQAKPPCSGCWPPCPTPTRLPASPGTGCTGSGRGTAPSEAEPVRDSNSTGTMGEPASRERSQRSTPGQPWMRSEE